MNTTLIFSLNSEFKEEPSRQILTISHDTRELVICTNLDRNYRNPERTLDIETRGAIDFTELSFEQYESTNLPEIL